MIHFPACQERGGPAVLLHNAPAALLRRQSGEHNVPERGARWQDRSRAAVGCHMSALGCSCVWGNSRGNLALKIPSPSSFDGAL
ncbi:hypothetical protein AAFF_G00252400 [Aldrovandia affinis]|uniref:Uncharacterized protein n=1 Tax=Aldrovandia affinis TaxID=143900 RepID=A0AAD7STP8_9TELE|nr:hypothetical protein AAFF_G00252400 [Aldrovandia affinis]